MDLNYNGFCGSCNVLGSIGGMSSAGCEPIDNYSILQEYAPNTPHKGNVFFQPPTFETLPEKLPLRPILFFISLQDRRMNSDQTTDKPQKHVILQNAFLQKKVSGFNKDTYFRLWFSLSPHSFWSPINTITNRVHLDSLFSNILFNNRLENTFVIFYCTFS